MKVKGKEINGIRTNTGERRRKRGSPVAGSMNRLPTPHSTVRRCGYLLSTGVGTRARLREVQ